MSYICKENTTDTVEGGDHLLLFGLFTKLSKAARVHPRPGGAAVTTSVGMSARQVASMRDAENLASAWNAALHVAMDGRPYLELETAQGPERVDLVLAGGAATRAALRRPESCHRWCTPTTPSAPNSRFSQRARPPIVDQIAACSAH